MFPASGGSVVYKLIYHSAWLNSDVLQTIQNTKNLQQPNHKDDYDNYIQNAFDCALHWNVAVHQPKDNPNTKNDKKNR